MTNEREWAKELDYLLSVLQSEQKADPKAFYQKPVNPFAENGNARARFLSEKMRAVLPHIEQLVRA